MQKNNEKSWAGKKRRVFARWRALSICCLLCGVWCLVHHVQCKARQCNYFSGKETKRNETKKQIEKKRNGVSVRRYLLEERYIKIKKIKKFQLFMRRAKQMEEDRLLTETQTDWEKKRNIKKKDKLIDCLSNIFFNWFWVKMFFP